jgi:hypothetical protein
MFESFYNKKEYTVDDLNSLITNEIEESINLDYKSAKSLDKSDRKKTEIAKDISAFANSDGGIIIYGINEENHKPKDFSYVNGDLLNKEWLENIIDGNIQQRISGIEIFPIRIDNLIEKTIYIVKTPSSMHAPHMSSDKKFYRRFNFKSVPMEEYETKLLYNRSSKAEIIHKISWCRALEDEYREEKKFIAREVTLHVENISQTLETHCKVDVYFTCDDKELISLNYSYPEASNIDYKLMKINELNIPTISSYNSSPIFPKEEFNILRFTVLIQENDYEKFWNHGIMNVIVYSSNGTYEEQDKVSTLFQKPE